MSAPVSLASRDHRPFPRTFYRALGIEAAGVALLIVCSVLTLPWISTETGTVSGVKLGRANNGAVDDSDRYWFWLGDSYFGLDGPPHPAAPALRNGETVKVDYLDLASGQALVLSITVSPGLPGRVYFVTDAGGQFSAGKQMANAAVFGLITGLVVVVVGIFLVVRAARKLGLGLGAVATSLAPVSAIGRVPLLGINGIFEILSNMAKVEALMWLVTGSIALGFAIKGRKEQPLEFARYSRIFVSVVGGVWLAWWIGSFIAALGRAQY